MVGIVVFLSGCIISKDECAVRDKKGEDYLEQAAPGAILSVALRGCSTCGHSSVTGRWEPSPEAITGDIEVQLVPHCFVRDTTVYGAPGERNTSADNNWKNCGDVIDVDAYVTNRTNGTLLFMSIDARCPSLEE